jgi:hypothetical protein
MVEDNKFWGWVQMHKKGIEGILEKLSSFFFFFTSLRQSPSNFNPSRFIDPSIY